MAADPYAVLGVAPEASLDEVRRAYHASCLRLHPDKMGGSADATDFHAVQGAWRVLSDDAARRRHDEERAQGARDLDAEARMAERVVFDEMRPSDAADSRSWPCRCGAVYELTSHELAAGSVVVVPCDGCSLSIRVE
ncbi:hypothetical protein KFE25_001796 [Diacronema lutheri]|uniref:Diphthamide biosynthesis protein 4 n=2 Tax=Diacronema lutheri TaxID=2081491 RepID=A0A8J5XAP3_DIALT|nr:hypothetical protein KFE25_001796 [Diacronema lutheri]